MNRFLNQTNLTMKRSFASLSFSFSVESVERAELEDRGRCSGARASNANVKGVLLASFLPLGFIGLLEPS